MQRVKIEKEKCISILLFQIESQLRTDHLKTKTKEDFRCFLLTWNRTKRIKNNNSSGFLNQKRSSRGLSFAPEKNSFIHAFSNAKVAITCCNFVPTRRTSCARTCRTK
jgi:hypothetical protein